MGLLEIAICMGATGTGYGGATDLLGLKYDDPVRIEFAGCVKLPQRSSCDRSGLSG